MFLGAIVGALMLGVMSGSAFALEKFKVVTTFTVIADMARNVAKDAAVVESITKPGAEIHNYQPTPGDIQKAQGAQLILWNGLNLELWFGKFFHNLRDVPGVEWALPRAPIPARPIPMPGCRQRTRLFTSTIFATPS
jgi:manganese/iron transport system substrate-binding protein